MRENELFRQLDSMKNIKPDDAWKRQNRELLRKQIYGSAADPRSAARAGIKLLAFNLPLQILKRATQPALTVALILLFMFGSGVYSLRVARETKPGDSLYIAKIIGERTQLVLTFNEKEKARLGIEFAGNRAKEISQVLAENNAQKDDNIEKLVDNFKKEISAARTRVARISGKNQASPETNAGLAPSASPVSSTTEAGNESDSIFSANLGKDDKGLSISSPAADDSGVKVDETPVTVPAVPAVPTSTEEIASTTATTTPAVSETVPAGNPETILKQAEESLADDNYDTTINKLDEAVSAINSVDTGQVKGESESADPETGATSTDSGSSDKAAATTTAE